MADSSLMIFEVNNIGSGEGEYWNFYLDLRFRIHLLTDIYLNDFSSPLEWLQSIDDNQI
jgi:hypothetical protein